jgi:hypothetical protein
VRRVWPDRLGERHRRQRSGYVPQINGSDTNFSHPYVLHYPGNGYPTDLPRPQLNTYTLQQYSDGTPYDNEVWPSYDDNP